MNILSIDTTTKIASVALKTDKDIIEKKVDNEITHSEKLLPLIDTLLKEKNLNINEIDKYIVLNGPGSFTGVRIGLATIKAFSMINKKEILSISALDAIALSTYTNLNLNNEKYILSLIDARNERVYYCLYKIYENDNKIVIEKTIEASNDLIENVLNNLKDTISNIQNENFIISGNCINNFKDLILKKYTNISLYDTYPTTTDLINILDKLNELKKYTFDTYTLDADYVRPSQAERIKNEQINK